MNFETSFCIANPGATPPATAHTSEELDATLQAYMDDLKVFLACMEGNDSGTLPNNSTEFQPDGGLYTTVAAGNMATHSADLGLGAVATPYATASASTSAPAPLPFADCGAYTNEFDFLSDLDLSALIMPSLENVSSIPPQLGDQTFSQHADEAVASKIVASSVLRSDLGIHGNSQSKQVAYAPPWDGTSFPSQTQWAGAETPTQVGTSEIMPHWYWSNTVDTNPTVEFTATPNTGGARRARTVLGKRARNSSMSWALDEAEGSRKRFHPIPATGVQHQDNNTSTTLWRGAESLAPTTVQGLYPHPMPGPSVPQEMVQSQDQLRAGGRTEGRDGLFDIPSNLTKRQRLMLRTTEEDVRRQAVPIIECRLCPTAELGSWQCFQRHCNTIEDHPVELSYCERCGDYFGRRDSLKRHLTKKNPNRCRKMPRGEAEKKITKTQELFDEFSMRMEDCLRTGEELGPRFAEIAQEYVQSTSKKPCKKRSGGKS